jgi:hypothetical protein
MGNGYHNVSDLTPGVSRSNLTKVISNDGPILRVSVGSNDENPAER